MKSALKKLSRFGLEINHGLDAGLSVFGLNIGRARHPYTQRSAVALAYCRALRPRSVLDVGSGGGQHATAFASDGAEVNCVDFGTSVYAKASAPSGNVSVTHADFTRWTPPKAYDLVWASHVLEHQRNVGAFVDRLVSCCAADGHVAIIVPFPHRRLWGGHLTLWTPGLLAYNIVLAGVDLSDAVLQYGYRETWIVFQPKRIALPPLTFDSGDIDLLAPYLPAKFRDNSEPWI